MNKSEIIERVADIYEEYKISKLGFDFLKLCKDMEIYLIKYSQFEDKAELLKKYDEDGFNLINPYNNHLEIYYNDEIQPQGRMCFTIPHELGHICLNHNIEFLEKETREQKEEADMFANALYCPRVLLKYFNLDSISALMFHFGISRGYADTLLDKYSRMGEITTAEKRLLNIFLKNVENKKNGGEGL